MIGPSPGMAFERLNFHRALATVAAVLLTILSVRGVADACTTVSGPITGSVTWGPTGSPPDTCYRVTSSIVVGNNRSLTIQAGTRIQFDPGASLIVYGPRLPAPLAERGGNVLHVAGSLTAVGTATAPIVFSATNGLRGGWPGILVDAGDVDVQHCVLRDGGEGGAAQVQLIGDFPSVKAFQHSVFEHHAGVGLENEARVDTTVVSHCVFRDFGSYPVTAYLDQVADLFPLNTFVPSTSHNAVVAIAGHDYYTGVLMSGTLSPPDPGFCYVLDNGHLPEFEVGTLTADAAVVKSSAGIRGTIEASGSIFTSTADDTLGDSTGDGPTTGAPGDWDGITLRDGTLDGCNIRFAGAPQAAGQPQSLRLEGGNLLNAVIEKGAGDGVYVFAFGSAANNLVREHAGFPVIAYPRWYELFPNGITIGPGVSNGYVLYEPSDAMPMAFLPVPPPGTCYATLSNVTLGANSPLRIQPGTLIKFGDSSGLRAGHQILAFDAVFTSLADDTLGDTGGDGPTSGAPGQWRGVTVTTVNTLEPVNIVAGCRIRYAGQGGLATIDAGISATVSGCYAERGLGPALRAPAERLPALIADNTFVVSTLGSFNAFEIDTRTVFADASLHALLAPFCYVLDGVLPVWAALSFGNGSILKLTQNGEIQVGSSSPGKLLAEGATFTSIEDDVIGDTGGDGPTVGAPGQWRSIRFMSQDAGSILRCSSIRNGGSTAPLLVVNQASPLIQNCTIANASIGALAAGATAKPVFYECTFTTTTGVNVTTGTPALAGCDLSGTTTGVSIFTTATAAAENCWWGSASGPNDPSPGMPDYNPGGTGVAVTDRVYYRPWLDAPPVIVCPTTTDVSPPPVALAVGRLALLSMSPNPGHAPWRIRFAAPRAGTLRIDVFDVTGRRVGGREVAVEAPGVQQTDIELVSAPPPGMYLISVRMAGQSAAGRLVVTR